MATTNLSALINPEVMAQMIEEYIGSKSGKFDAVVTEDNTLVATPGNTIKVPKWGYIGDAADVAEGVAVVPAAMSSSSVDVTVKKAVKAVTLTDEAVVSGFGDPIGTATRQIGESIVQKKDRDVVTALDSATTVKGDGTAVISLADLLAAKMLFGDEDDDFEIQYYTSPTQYGKLVALLEAKDTPLGDYVRENGEVTRVYGMRIHRSNKCTTTGTGASKKYSNYLAKAPAVKIYNKRGINSETERDAKKGATDYVANKHYVAHLADDRYAVKYIVKA